MSERLDVRRMLLHRDWAEDYTLGPLRKGGAVWAVTNDCGDSGLSGRGRKQTYTIEFPSHVPARVIVAACEAATEKAPESPADVPSPVSTPTEAHGEAEQQS